MTPAPIMMDGVVRGLPGPPQWLASNPGKSVSILSIGLRCPCGGVGYYHGTLRRPSETLRETPHIPIATMGARGPLNGSGLLYIDSKGERNQRFLSPRRRKVVPRYNSSLDRKGLPGWRQPTDFGFTYFCCCHISDSNLLFDSNAHMMHVPQSCRCSEIKQPRCCGTLAFGCHVPFNTI